jgi:hypothetical protein
MNTVRTLISVLIVAIAVLSILGIFWWNSPPEPVASYATGGQVILGILVASSVLGLWRLWAPSDVHDGA